MTDDEGYRGIMLFGMAILVLKLAIVPELVGFFHTVSAFFGNTPAPVVELVKCLVIRYYVAVTPKSEKPF